MNLHWKIAVTPNTSGVNPWPARVSVPLPRGTKHNSFSIKRPDGQIVPAQSRELVRWADGSPRWVQLDFQATQAGDHVVSAGNAPTHVGGYSPSSPVQAKREGDKFSIGVGRMTLSLAPNAASPIESVKWNGRELGGSSKFTAVDSKGKPFPLAKGTARNITVEADGPHRYQVSWETHHAEKRLDVRFRVEVLAGIEGFSLSYQFFHKLPKHDTLRFRSLHAEFPFSSLKRAQPVVAQSSYGNIGLPRFVRPKHPVTMHVDRTRYGPYAKTSAELDDEFDYPPFLANTNLGTGNAVALEGNDVAVVFAMREFELQRPKLLTIEPGGFSVGIWPQEAGTLTLPQGRSKRQVFCFRFCESKPDSVEALLANPASCLLEPSVCWLDKADSVHAGATWDQPRLLTGAEPGAAFFSNLLSTATKRWETIPEMFDYGDTVDTGYAISYPSQGRTPGSNAQYTFTSHTMVLHGHFHTPDHLPPVWSNNEYDAIYCLALEAIRARDLNALRKLGAAARHQIEVDFVHYSDHWQQHRSTPQHSYDHTSLMSSIPSHQWTQGLYYYYALTGDDDAPEIIRAICDYNLQFLERDEVSFGLYFNRELGWALIALVFGYEATADARYLAMSKRIIEKLQKDASRTDVSLNATGLGGGFNVNTIPIGVKAYYQATGEEWAKKPLLEWIEFGMKNFNDKSTGVKFSELFPETFCYVCELTGDNRYLKDSIWQLRMLFHGFGSLDWLESMGRPLATKLYTRNYRGLVFYLSALARAGMLENEERRLIGDGKD